MKIRWNLAFSLAFAVLPISSAFAMPPAPVAGLERQSDIVDAAVVCDPRGCFGYGPRQFYLPPSYRPNNSNGSPYYYRPGAAGPPRFTYQPPAPTLQPAKRPPPRGGSLHVQWCLDHYRSYNPATNRYMISKRESSSCRSPYRK